MAFNNANDEFLLLVMSPKWCTEMFIILLENIIQEKKGICSS